MDNRRKSAPAAVLTSVKVIQPGIAYLGLAVGVQDVRVINLQPIAYSLMFMESHPSDESASSPFAIRPCRPSDRQAILALIDPYVQQRKILRRTFEELEELSANSFVAESAGRIVGFVALEIYSAKLAEIRSLVVAADWQGRGLGKRLVAACVDRAREQGVFEVMAVTSSEEFFRSCGFDYTLPGEKKAFFLQTREHH